MQKDDTRYYRQRAETEIERARQASVPEAKRIHHELAEAYLSKIGLIALATPEAS
jgi:hypothetical protein